MVRRLLLLKTTRLRTKIGQGWGLPRKPPTTLGLYRPLPIRYFRNPFSTAADHDRIQSKNNAESN